MRDLGGIPLRKLKPSHILEAYAHWGQEQRRSGLLNVKQNFPWMSIRTAAFEATG
jgi:hypothetical protein